MRWRDVDPRFVWVNAQGMGNDSYKGVLYAWVDFEDGNGWLAMLAWVESTTRLGRPSSRPQVGFLEASRIRDADDGQPPPRWDDPSAIAWALRDAHKR